MQAFKTIRRIYKPLLFLAAVVIAFLTIGYEWFPESTFELASESRLPKWITLPPGITRADVSITMSYYVMPWGRSSIFVLRDKNGRTLTKVKGNDRGLGPNQLKHPSLGYPHGYPLYEVITVNGITEIIEHGKMEPLFYINDDPVVRKELGVGQE